MSSRTKCPTPLNVQLEEERSRVQQKLDKYLQLENIDPQKQYHKKGGSENYLHRHILKNFGHRSKITTAIINGKTPLAKALSGNKNNDGVKEDYNKILKV